MALTSAQKRTLKGIAQTMPDDLRVGKEGLSESFLGTLRELFQRRELVKLRFGELEGGERKAFARELAGAADAQLVQVLGRTVLLYRPNPQLKERVL